MNNLSIVFDASGTCFVCGENDRGQLGVGHTDRINTFTALPAPSSNNTKIKFVRVFCGGDFSFFESDTKQWYCVGDNSNGQLGLGHISDTINQLTPVSLPSPSLKIDFVSCGEYHTIFVCEDGVTCFGCGRNQYGQLGLAHNTLKVPTPTKIAIPNNNIIKQVSCG